MKRRIEVMEDPYFLDGKEKHYLGDIYTEDAEKAQAFINAGWAKCVETGECGERVEGTSKIQPANVVQKVTVA